MTTKLLLFIALLAVASAAGAQTPGAPVNVSDSAGLSSSPAAVTDATGTIHVAWTDSADAEDPSEQYVLYARSFDGGASFEPPRQVSAPAGASMRSARQVRLVADRSGEVQLAWWDTTVDGSGRRFATAFVATSRDGGRSLGQPVQTTLRFREDVAPKEGFTNLTSLSLATGPAGQIYLLATVQDYYHGFNVYFCRSANGSTFAKPVRVSNYTGTIPRAAANALTVLPRGEIYALWTESNGDFVDEIKNNYFVSSSDGGRTFSAPLRVANARGVAGALSAEDGSVRLLTQFQNGPRADHAIRLYTSDDDGRSFPRRARIGIAASNSHLNQASIASNPNGVIAVAWVENSSRPGPSEGIYVAASTDGGRSFGSPELVAEGIFPDPPAVTVDTAGRIGVVYVSSALSAVDREVLFAVVAR